MKKPFFFIVCFTFTFIVFLSSCVRMYTCPSCGGKVSQLYECPICSRSVCLYCVDDEWYLENLYNSGIMEEYLREHGYVVFSELQDAYDLYGYGFVSGYMKGIDGIYDDEVSEFFDGYDYDRLDETYRDFSY